MNKLKISGMPRFSMLDYPGELAATVFLSGCPLRCSYCHNPGLWRAEGKVDWETEIEPYLRGRVGRLDAVVFSGGEPLVQKALGRAVARCKAIGYKVGMHTSGYRPDALRRLIAAPESTPDWVGLDIKGLPDDYERIAGKGGPEAWESLGILLGAVNLEVRTTLPEDWEDRWVSGLADTLRRAGVEEYAVQVPRGTRAPDQQLLQEVGHGFARFTCRP